MRLASQACTRVSNKVNASQACTRVSNKVNALTRMSNSLSEACKLQLVLLFATSSPNYCPNLLYDGDWFHSFLLIELMAHGALICW